MPDFDLLHELRQLPFVDEDCHLSAAKDGVINRNYRLRSGDSDYFVKTFGGEDFAAVDRQQVFYCQRRLAGIGLAPRPVYLSEEHHFQLDSWVDVPTLAGVSLTENDKAFRLATALTRIHSLDISAPCLNLPASWQHYLTHIERPLRSQLQAQVDELSPLWQPAAECFCHNDLSLGHLPAGDNALIYDWEYAACGNRYFDIASCVAINSLRQQTTELLLRQYAELNHLSFDQVTLEYQQQLEFVALTNKLWTLASGNVDK